MSTHSVTTPRADTSHARYLAAPLVGTATLMAAYLLLRPYGDATGSETLAAAEAFASWRWLAAHLCGLLALASVGRLALRLHDQIPRTTTRLARWLGLAGTVAVLPYYGLETFGLFTIGQAALDGNTTALALVDPMRDHPVALTTFGLGLVLLAGCGIAMAIAWKRSVGTLAAWPLGVMIALMLPQFYLPPTGRMIFGIIWAIAAMIWLRDAARDGR